ncbi:glycosyltransferase family 24 protein [Acrodontium crateriforme]|uniref:Glycosyltransferase family 24 protein n=1 Tax=Acrodontium crateriforme TaxID=150365 RepID=A0AAQ3M3L5_9PEZI|nr:glycosyltransferase family 24 protein [Acrodontium crateriforme]
MRVPSNPLALGASILLCGSWAVHATPSVNVALRTAFDAPPYLVELLETAAQENATSYFPILDRIADGYFDTTSTDEELYERFRSLLQKDGHLSRPEDLSSFDFALAIHSTAPRIEAHYQYYKTSVKIDAGQEDAERCETWLHVPFSGKRYCSPNVAGSQGQSYGVASEDTRKLPFDRILGDDKSRRPSVVYADITSKSFRQFHKTISATAKDGKTSYRVRYRPSAVSTSRPLAVSGYGVELALKRTDYIVIDDRKEGEEDGSENSQVGESSLSDEEVSDLRPLSSSELRGLGMRASSFVMDSENPFDTLVKLSQDFPKHSSAIAATNISDEFLHEHMANREIVLPSGYNVIWINGVQIMARDFDAYALLEYLRRERKLINGVTDLGLTKPEAIDLLAHEAITASSLDQDLQRYDWRDETEGGDVIIWMNDIEKDQRYADWSSQATSILQRTYPGQLPSLRRNLHHVVIPIDFADYADVALVVDTLQNFVKRKIPIRFGLVPRLQSSASVQQAKVVYYLLERHGLGAMLDYMGKSAVGAGRKFGAPQQQYLEQASEGRKFRKDRVALQLDEIVIDSDLHDRTQRAQSYLSRLGGSSSSPSILANGVPIPRSDQFLQIMSQRVGMDLQQTQKAVYEETLTEDSYFPDLFLAKASLRRNTLITPEDDKEIRQIELALWPELEELPGISADPETIERELVHMVLAADFNSKDGFAQLMEALVFKTEHDNIELAVVHVPGKHETDQDMSSKTGGEKGDDFLRSLIDHWDSLSTSAPETDRQSIFDTIRQTVVDGPWKQCGSLCTAIGLAPGQKAVVINGRVVGPMMPEEKLEAIDFATLLDYERKKRLLPAALAIESLPADKRPKTPLAFARMSNLIALSQISDVPEGIFEAAPTVRTGIFKQWNAAHTAIHTGSLENSNIQIYTSIDPASEIGQRWIPILKAISELDGVYVSLFLNPLGKLTELPIKRFYRHVIASKPTFTSDGAVEGLSARFSGLPADALLNMGMDLPPSWLVAPKDSVHDLDNIKLSAVKTGSDIEAIYELEHILIEGHSKEVGSGPPPRGAQLVLGTELDPHVADTIIMANLGYFQFKANPGIYNLAMQKGRSEEIFHIDSAGTLGQTAQPGDNGTEIALMSFRGTTLFPRISRNPGMEEEDVLEASKTALESLAGEADKLLAKAGLPGVAASKYISQASKLGSNLLSGLGRGQGVATQQHADINIFSVASGHLYERMLNIMMVSVMKHTNRTVKFWFIEQFLSPSFKRFLPTLAEEYGFKYEMVTYKWPHWLRSQKEKQREIWGYKILFLDVLFPLDLDKVIFVDADQIVRTDMYELVQHDLKGAAYGFTPMCDSRTEMEGFRFWKQGYWKNFLRGLPYHISALYVVDLKKFREIAAGDRLRQQYHQLSADPNSLSNLDQDLPNNMQMQLPIHSLPQEWLWCETWCSDEALKEAKTIDLCNNPQTKEPKLDRARRQVPEWTVYDDEIAALAKRRKDCSGSGGAAGCGAAGSKAADHVQDDDDESIQERLQREDAEKEQRNKVHIRDEL